MTVGGSLIRTVLGDIEPEELGPTQAHEHLLFSPAPRFGDDLMRREEDRTVQELRSYRRAGGSGLVDATVEELGRDAAAVARISRHADVHVVAATGHTSEDWWWEECDPSTRSRDEMSEEMTTDLTDGIGNSDAPAGVIKVGTSLDRITDAEARVMEAAVVAQRRTGAPITTHTTAGTVALDQATSLLRSGADPARVCVGHLDRRLIWDEHLAVARTGAYLGYDQISKERHTPDSKRADFVARLVTEGFGERILLACDLTRRSDLAAWGGSPGLGYLLDRFVPLLEARGLTRENVHAILVENPRRFLAWA
jgi:predicted metal-dependent phosphotriesterase family hydrolase